MPKLRIAGVVNDSIVDGEGIRLTVFVQGCSHRCKGCHNPETWNYNGGHDVDISEIIKEYRENPLLQGITFSGGEPFDKVEPLSLIADKVHKLNGDVWCYTGYTLEQLEKDTSKHKLLSRVDVLVDGPFIEAERDLSLNFRGSRNQHIYKKENGIFVKRE